MASSKKVATALKAMVEEDNAAHAILSWLSTFTNHTPIMSVEAVERGATKWARQNLDQESVVSRQDVISVMKQLGKLELGLFIVGRRGGESRFEFKTKRGDIGKAAIGEISQIEVQEDDVELDESDIIDTHRMLIAHALGKPISAVRISIRE